MKLLRLVVLTGVVASWQVSPVMAESLLQSATRLTAQAARQVPPAARAGLRRSATAEQAAPAESGMSGRKKVLLVVASLMAAGAAMYAIDRSVVDNTPSSKGTRKD